MRSLNTYEKTRRNILNFSASRVQNAGGFTEELCYPIMELSQKTYSGFSLLSPSNGNNLPKILNTWQVIRYRKFLFEHPHEAMKHNKMQKK